jgi:carbon-monoxide dehydrogenase large subunit
MTSSPRLLVGNSVKRKEDPRLVNGKGLYISDVSLPDQLYLSIYRSSYAHAGLGRVDVSRALSQKGIVAAITGKDVLNLPLPLTWATDSMPGLRTHPTYCLAVNKVRYAGEPVAAVVGEDPYASEDALQLIEADYSPLPVVIDAEKALENDAPVLYEEWGDNVLYRSHFKGGDPDKALREADLVLDERIPINRYTAVPMETRAYVAQYNDSRHPRLTVWTSSQVPHIVRTLYSETLGVPENEIRVIMPDVGGSFGMKHPLFPEEVLVPHLAMKLGRPIKYVEKRMEHLVASNHAREITYYARAGFRKDGTILGLKCWAIANNGAFHPYIGVGSQYVSTLFVPGTYRIQDYEVELTSAVTNKCPWGPYRGYGKDASAMVIETIMSRAARRLGMDAAEIRFKNFIRPNEFPYTSICGPVYDSGNYPECLRKLLKLSNYDELRKEQESLRKQGRYIGIGIAYALEPASEAVPNSLYSGYEACTVRMNPSGKVSVLTGIVSHGTGLETAISQIVADTLGVKFEDVTVIQGDTESCPYGLGSWSSRFAFTAVPSLIGATKRLKQKILSAAAHMLEASVGDLESREGHITIAGVPNDYKSLSIRDVVRTINTRPDLLPSDFQPGLDETYYYKTPNVRHAPDEMGRLAIYPTYPNNVNMAVVEVDPGNGEVKVLKYYVVHDCGPLINPMLAEGQIFGGIAQGIGGALLEELSYDENGQMLASTFMDYLLPTTREIPKIVVEHNETPSPFNEAGFKGCGEGGAIGSPAAITNAVEDALSPFNSLVSGLPLTPERVWRLVAKGSRQK